MKTLLTTLTLFVFALAFSAGLSAATGDKTVKGKIKTSSSANAAGASVTVTCDGNVLNDTTDSNGDYEVVFTAAQCQEDDLVTVDASFNGESGSDSKEVGNGPNVNFNVIFLAGIAVPEFGAITGVVAALTSGAAFIGLRRKFS